MQDPALADPLRIVAPIPLIYAVYAVNVGTVNATRRFQLQASLDIFMAATKAGLIIGAAALSLGLTWILGGFTLASLLAFGLSIVFVTLSRPQTAGGGAGPLAPMANFAIVLAVFTAGVNVLQGFDLFLLKRYALTAAQDDALGFYSSAQLIARVPYSMMNAVSLVMFPLIATVIVATFCVIIAFDDLRRERIFAYLDPWNPKYAQGKAYQLTHSLIAFGRGEIFGQGLGGSVEKLNWLPEAHTDFLLAVIGEELGFVGVACVIVAFFWLTRRIFHIGRQSIALDRIFAGLYAQGVGIWFGGQAFVNMGVNLGVLPTKGLTLPLMSYGGSAIVMNLVALAIVLRIDLENRQLMRGGRA